MAVVEAEAVWLACRPGDPRTARILDVARARPDDDPWLLGELLVWLDRLGLPRPRTASPARPYALELAGEHLAAAAWWRRASCPFDEALVRTRTTGEGHLAAALEPGRGDGGGPGGGPAAPGERDAGERSVPRGARPATRADPHGLTPREVEVLALLRDGPDQRRHRRRLYISERTVHRHVSAVPRQARGVLPRRRGARPIWVGQRPT
jgi:hypothetical protein